MSKEIVSKLLSNKKRVIFESVDSSNDEETLLDSEEDLIEETPEDSVGPEEESISGRDQGNEICVCGSTDIVEEEGKMICNDCGRDLSIQELSEPLIPRDVEKEIDESEEDKASKLRAVLSIWNQGNYQRAMELCKRYGISDREFAFALVKSFRESDELVDDLDTDDLDESLSDIGYIVVYNYDGDDLSDYEGSILVAAQSDREAIKKAEDKIKKKKSDARHFYVREKVLSISDWKKQYPKSNTEILESKRVVEANNPAKFNYVGERFQNAGYFWEILATKGEYTLVYAKSRNSTPYTVAWRLQNDGSWNQGHYFNSKEEALNYLKKQPGTLHEDATMEIISPTTEDTLEKNIIRAIHTPMTTADKPDLDAAIMEAMTGNRIKESSERTYTESELINFLKNSNQSPIYVRTTFIKTGWDDVQFAARRAGYRVSKLTNRKDILNKLGLSGNFADFYQFTKIDSKNIKESVDVDTSRWSFSTGKSKPSGYGVWWFEIGKEEVEFSGMYADCKKKAIQYANQRGIQKISLLS